MESLKPKPCSTKKKKKRGKSVSLQPFITTISKTTTTTTTINIITPPEDIEAHTYLYLCLRDAVGPHDHRPVFKWVKIDPFFSEEQNQNNRILLSPVSEMPPDTAFLFRPIADSSHNTKLIYAVGGVNIGVGSSSPKTPPTFSSHTYVCDFSDPNESCYSWKQLPPLPLPLKLHSGVALDGKIFVFGVRRRLPGGTSPCVGMVFDTFSHSWSMCRPPNIEDYRYTSDINYTIVHSDNHSSGSDDKFLLFDGPRGAYLFYLSTGIWERIPSPVIPGPRYDGVGPHFSCVAVGDIVYMLVGRKLYTLDLTLDEPSLKTVRGFERKLPKHEETYFKGHLFYIGKGKFCIVWGRAPYPHEPGPVVVVHITCMSFWVGVCNQTNQYRAVVDRCDMYYTDGAGCDLYNVVAL